MAMTSWTECLFSNIADYTAFNTSNSEGSLMAGVNRQPSFLPPFWMDRQGKGRLVKIHAAGVMGCTGTPTIIWQARLGTTAGSTYLSGTSVGVSAAITMQSGVTNQRWELDLALICTTDGIGTGNTTLAGSGKVLCFGGFASPFAYDLEPTTPATATWTCVIDNSLTQYLNLSVTWSASSGSNTVTLKQLYVLACN